MDYFAMVSSSLPASPKTPGSLISHTLLPVRSSPAHSPALHISTPAYRPAPLQAVTATTPKHDRPGIHSSWHHRQSSGRSTPPALPSVPEPMPSPAKHSPPSPIFSGSKRFQPSSAVVSPPHASLGLVCSPSSPALARACKQSRTLSAGATTPHTPLGPSPPSLAPVSSLVPLRAEQLVHWVRTEDAETLVLDMRSPSLNNQARVKGSVSINIPSTLLRRPMFGVDRVESTVDCQPERLRFARYRTAQQSPPAAQGHHPIAGPSTRIQRIVVYDGDSKLNGPLPASHPCALILSKFCAANVKADLAYVLGGFAAICAVQGSNDIIEGLREQLPSIDRPLGRFERSGRMSLVLPPPCISAPPDGQPPSESDALGTCSTPLAAPALSNLGPLPLDAFTDASIDIKTKTPPARSRLAKCKWWSSEQGRSKASPSELSGMVGNPGHQTRHHSACVNPFFDNIRQLNERLDLARTLEDVAPVVLPQLPASEVHKLPDWVKELLLESPHQRGKRLAHEFFDLEAAEMRRLQDVMTWHSHNKESSQAQHPFSIAAGVELGHKNRYKNIWPWEHARVHLEEISGNSDYINASLIRFRGTEKQYIATQGPLHSTFSDFWHVVAEQNVGVIVMLTRQHEAGREKCGDYLRSGVHGNIVVNVDGVEGCDGQESMSGDGGFFDFGPSPEQAATETDAVVVKSVWIGRKDHPEWPDRHIRHVQYRCWPDFDVPPKSQQVLDLIDICNREAQTVKAVNISRSQEVGNATGPMLVHCSAGVGRTGSYIVIDALLDAFRREGQAQTDSPVESSSVQSSVNGSLSSQSSILNSGRGVSPMTDVEDYDLSQPSRVDGKWMSIDSPCRSQSHSSSVSEAGSEHSPIRDSSVDELKRKTTTSHTNASTPMQVIEARELCKGVATADDGGRNCMTGEWRRQSTSSSGKRQNVPDHFETKWCDVKESRTVAPLCQTHPILPAVNEMREQRMSMVANYRQYVYIYETILYGLMRELNISPVDT